MTLILRCRLDAESARANQQAVDKRRDRVPLCSKITSACERASTISNAFNKRRIARQIVIRIGIVPVTFVYPVESNKSHQRGLNAGALRGVHEVSVLADSDHRFIGSASFITRSTRNVDPTEQGIEAAL